MKRFFIYLSGLLLAFSTLMAAGCADSIFESVEDKETAEAKEFKISQQLDNAEYGFILSHPELVDPLDFAAAAIGAAGFDISTLVDAINKMGDTDNPDTETNDMSAILEIALEPGALEHLTLAKEQLEKELEANPDDPVLNLQATITSFTTVATAIAAIGKDSGLVTVDEEGKVSLEDTDEILAVAEFIGNNPDIKIDTDGDGIPDTELIEIIGDNIIDVMGSPDGLGGTLEKAGIADSTIFDAIKDTTEGEGSIDFDGDGEITSEDLKNYLTEVIAKEEEE